MAVWRGGDGGSSCLLGEEWRSRELRPLTSFVNSIVPLVRALAHVVVLRTREESPHSVERYDEYSKTKPKLLSFRARGMYFMPLLFSLSTSVLSRARVHQHTKA